MHGVLCESGAAQGAERSRPPWPGGVTAAAGRMVGEFPQAPAHQVVLPGLCNLVYILFFFKNTKRRTSFMNQLCSC